MESLQEYDKSISCIDRANFVQIEELRENDTFIYLNYLDMKVIIKVIRVKIALVPKIHGYRTLAT